MKAISYLMLVLAALVPAWSGSAVAQASAQARQIQEQAAALLAQARRCPELPKSLVDRFAARASAVVARADGIATRRGSAGEFDQISASLEMAASCKSVVCPGKPRPLNAPDCNTLGPQFKALRINQDSWLVTEGLK